MANQSRPRSQSPRPQGQTTTANGDPAATESGAKPVSRQLGGKASDEVKRPVAGATHIQPRRAERRPEMIKRRREERLKAYERQRRTWLMTRVGLIAFAVLVVGSIAFAVFNTVQDRVNNRVPDGTLNFDYGPGDHTTSLEATVDYAENPPVGGTHAPAPYWQTCGFYSSPIRNESGVHSLEHGAVWITYRPDLPQDQIDELRDLAHDQDYLLVSRDDDLPAPVVASSWNHQLRLDSANDDRLDQFIRRFKQGPDTPEPGASCSNGVGTPE